MNEQIPTQMIARMLSEKERTLLQAMVLTDRWQFAPTSQGGRAGRVLTNLSDRYGIFEVEQGKTAGRRRYRARAQAFELQRHLLTAEVPS